VGLASGSIARFDLSERTELGVLAPIDQDDPEAPWMTLPRFELAAPTPRPRGHMSCVNNRGNEHALEFTKTCLESSAAAGAGSKDPIIFFKAPEPVVAGRANFIIDSIVYSIDCEALAAIIGKKAGLAIARKALDHGRRDTIINDMMESDLLGKYSRLLISRGAGHLVKD
jgi:2-keto-4-pentenoate hydratase/2-oxohepta-3-ene-1,7-dioic acid hydratase in catechol pathway